MKNEIKKAFILSILLRKINFSTLWLAFALMNFSVYAQQNDLFPIPEDYQLEGIPSIKKSEVEHLFYDPTSVKSNLIWDADQTNRRLLVTDTTNHVYLLNSVLGQTEKLLDKIVPYSVKFRPDGSSFAYTTDQEDEDNYQLYLYEFNNRSSKKLINLTGKDEWIDSFIWNKKGDALLYTRVDYASKISKLCQFDFVAERCFQVDLPSVWNVLDVSDTKVLLKYWKASGSQLIYVFDINSNKLIPIEDNGNNRKAFFANDSVFWISEGNAKCGKDSCVYSLNLMANQLNQIKLPQNLVSVNDLKISPNGNFLLIQETRDGIDNLRIFELKKNKIIKEVSRFITGSYVVWNTRWLTNNEVVYTLETIGKPASIQSFDIKSKKYTNWTQERLPQQLSGKVRMVEPLKWKSFDEKEITGFIVRPTETKQKKTSVLIYVHGGPQLLDKPTFNSQDIRFASGLGLTVIHTNIRGSSGFGKEFMDADDRENRGNAVKDIQALIDWVEKQPDLDAGQIYLRGVSYGGFIVLSVAMQEPSRIKGVIAEYPLISIKNYLSQSWVDEFTKTEYGDLGDEKLITYLDSLSPLNNAKMWNNIPLLITRGKLDSRVPESDVIDLKNQLKAKGSEVWFIFSTKSGHGFGSQYVTAAMYQFLKKQINRKE